MLNVEAFLAASSGLLIIFIIIMKFSTAILQWLNLTCNCRQGCCQNVTHAILAVVAAFIKIGLALFCALFGMAGTLTDDERNTSILRFIAMHASQDFDYV